MLRVYDQNHNTIGSGFLTEYKGLKVDTVLEDYDKTLSFEMTNMHVRQLKCEYYLQDENDEYVIKKINQQSGKKATVTAALNLEDLEGMKYTQFALQNTTLINAIQVAIEGTGWTVEASDDFTDSQKNAGMVDCSGLQVIRNLCDAWMAEYSFSTLSKVIHVYKKMGSAKGIYFLDGLNLKQIKKDTDSYGFATVLYPIGKDGLTIESVNEGSRYITDHTYSNKNITEIWKDESYETAQALKDDAEIKLAELARPVESYSAEIADLARLQPEIYEHMGYELGDTIRIANRETNTYIDQRIVKLTVYPDNPEKNKCEIASNILRFEKMQSRLKKAAEVIEFLITQDGRFTGTVSVSNILNFESGIQGSGTVQRIGVDMEDLRALVADGGIKESVLSVATDLNTVTTFGCYTCGNSSILTNKPEGAGYGYLVVLPSSPYIAQIYVEIVNANGQFAIAYQRMRNQNGGWSAWTALNRNKRMARAETEYVAYGYVTSGATELHLCIPVRYGAYATDGDSAPTLTKLIGSIRLPTGGYIGGSGYNFLTSGATIQSRYYPGGIRITATLAGGWKTGGTTGTAITNNIPVVGNVTIAGTF